MASSIYTTGQQPKFTGFTQASGDLSLLSKTPEEKLNTFGWKVTTNEEQFSTKTLIGNWNEERFDVKELRRRKPLPSQYNHYFQTTYGVAYNSPSSHLSQKVKYSTKHESSAFPSHQPLLDPPTLKAECNSYLTTSREAYIAPPPPAQPAEEQGKRMSSEGCKQEDQQ